MSHDDHHNLWQQRNRSQVIQVQNYKAPSNWNNLPSIWKSISFFFFYLWSKFVYPVKKKLFLISFLTLFISFIISFLKPQLHSVAPDAVSWRGFVLLCVRVWWHICTVNLFWKPVMSWVGCGACGSGSVFCVSLSCVSLWYLHVGPPWKRDPASQGAIQKKLYVFIQLYVYFAICRLAENTHDASIAFIHGHAVVTDRCHVTLWTEDESHFRILMGSRRNVHCTRMRLARKKKYLKKKKKMDERTGRSGEERASVLPRPSLCFPRPSVSFTETERFLGCAPPRISFKWALRGSLQHPVPIQNCQRVNIYN